MTPIKALVAESNPEVALAIIQTLEQANIQVVYVTDGQSVMDILNSQQIDIILLALHLPDAHGFSICRQLRSEGKWHPIILLSLREEERDLVTGIELGADDYLYVPFHAGELLARVHAVLRRSKFIRPAAAARQVVMFDDVTIDLERVRVTRGGRLIEITPTEFRILRYLVEHRNQTCERNMLMDYLRGSQSADITPRTIDVHIRRLRQKLEADPAHPRWLVTVHGIGYRFEDRAS
ncbi:MAG: response regulator transcription factor [Caldilineaceae bacterium]